MEDEFEESPDMQEDEEMIGDEDMLSDQVSQGDADEDGEGSLLGGRFSENDAIESSENSRPQNTEDGDENFEDFIEHEEDQQRVKSGSITEEKFSLGSKAVMKITKKS